MKDLINVDWSKIPAPIDDGSTLHLLGQNIPKGIALRSTSGVMIDLSSLKGKTIVYAYPKTGRPDIASLDGWDMIPGARGCTPQSCAFRDHYTELHKLGINYVFGLSIQDTLYQQEAVSRLHLPFALLSDEQFMLTEAMKFPTFNVGNIRLLKRFTLFIKDGLIKHVFYPIFPPDYHAIEVIEYLSSNTDGC